jgi:hypothetical protein
MVARIWHRSGLRRCQTGAIMAHMELQPYIDEIHRQLETAAQVGGDDARALAEQLVAPLDAAIRLAFLEVLATAAQEITFELAPGSVEVRLRGRDPEFIVTVLADETGGDPAGGSTSSYESSDPAAPGVGSLGGDEGGMARINLRLPDHLKVRVDRAATAEGLSANAWLVRAAASALDRIDSSRGSERPGPRGAQRFSGWVRS